MGWLAEAHDRVFHHACGPEPELPVQEWLTAVRDHRFGCFFPESKPKAAILAALQMKE
jgi:hypothetical protein